MCKIKSEFLDALEKKIDSHSDIILNQSKNDLIWISANRDFGENERYRVKEDVDESLVNSEIITNEREYIRSIFKNFSDAHAVCNYVKRLDEILNNLHNVFSQAAREAKTWDLQEHMRFWQVASQIADKDNAHAMYLSSGNWKFSVFDELIEYFQKWTIKSPAVFADLLSGGTQDIRTSIQHEFSTSYLSLSREEFINSVCQQNDYYHSNGAISIVCYTPATGQKGTLNKELIDNTIGEKFSKAVDKLSSLFPNEPVREIASTYKSLYKIRCLYDTYEYFGSYAFLRNMAIMHLCNEAKKENSKFADRMRYLTSTYQYKRTFMELKEACDV